MEIENSNVGNKNKEFNVKKKNLVSNIASYFGANKECINKGEHSEILVLSENDFLVEIRRWGEEVLGLDLGMDIDLPNKDEKIIKILKLLGTNPDILREKALENKEKFREIFQEDPGVCLKDNEGKIKIILNKDAVDLGEEEIVLTHELIHAMVYTNEEERGFKGSGSKELNEAMVQLMTLRIINSQLAWSDFKNKVVKNEIGNHHYNEQVTALMVIMEAADFKNEGEKIFFESATNYFNGEDRIKTIMFKMKLFGSIPQSMAGDDQFKNRVISLYEKMFDSPKKAARS